MALVEDMSEDEVALVSGGGEIAERAAWGHAHSAVTPVPGRGRETTTGDRPSFRDCGGECDGSRRLPKKESVRPLQK
jgi:hypothetical protein